MASAQTPSERFDINHLWLPPGPGKLVTVRTTDISDHLRVFAGLHGQYQHRPLVLQSSTEENVEVVGGQAQLDAMVAFGLFGWSQLTLAAPLSLIQVERDLDAVLAGERVDAVIRGPFLRDIRVGLDLRPVERVGSRPGLRGSFVVALPSGNVAAFGGHGETRIAGTIISDIQLGEVVVAAEVGIRGAFTPRALGQGRYGSLLIPKLGAAWQPRSGSALVLEASSCFQLASQTIDTGVSQHVLEVGLGGAQRMAFGSDSVVRGIFSIGAGGPGAPAFRFLLGLDMKLGS